MRTISYFLFLPLIAFIAGCADFPPIEQTLTFNIDRSVSFSFPSAVSLNKDTSLIAIGQVDTNAYTDSLSAGYLLKTAQVGRISIATSDPNFTLDKLGYMRILIGTDTVGIDTLPQGTTDDNFILTHADITKYMRDTSFAATLQCTVLAAPQNPVTLNCTMTVIYTANIRP